MRGASVARKVKGIGLVSTFKVRTLIAGFVMLAPAWLGGCSLPGYEIEAGSPWYTLSGDDPRYRPDSPPPEPVEYSPTVKQITADLILRLRAEPGRQPTGSASKPPGLDAQSAHPFVDYPDYEYKLGVGDVLSVTVFGHPGLTNPGQAFAGGVLGGGLTSAAGASAGRMVTANGKLYFPYVGLIQAAGRTVSEIRKEITAGLARVIREPQVDVRVAQYRSQAAYLVGDVPQPCRVPITDLPRTVIDALVECNALQLAQRGAGREAAQPTTWPSITLIRDGEPWPIPLATLYRQGGPKPRLLLRDGDRIYLADDKRVYMVGEFQTQAVVPIPASGLSLARAIGAAGGITVTSADPEEIYVIRGFIDTERSPSGELIAQLKPTIYHLDAGSVHALILAEQFPLQAKDIVFAAPADLVNFNRALALLLPSVSLLFRSAIISETVSDQN